MNMAPQSLDFGHITRGSTPAKSAIVTFQGSAMQLVSVQSESNYVQLAARGIRNTGAEMTYEVTATMRPDTPVGKWYTDIWLNTNNAASPRIRLPLSVDVDPSLTLSTPAIVFGSLKPGDKAEKRVIVRGPQPFKITSIEGADDALSAAPMGDGPKLVHVLIVGFKPATIGEFSRTLKIGTDLAGENTAQLPVRASVLMPHAE